jgi:alpha-tubulin suppressor-like RCC1 family protein
MFQSTLSIKGKSMFSKSTKLRNLTLSVLLFMTGIVGCGEITGLTPGPPPGCVGDECLIDEASSYPKPENLVATVTGTDRVLTWSWTESDPYSKIQEVIIQRKLESAPETAFANIAVVEGSATTYTDEAPAAGYIVYRVYVQYNSNLDATKSNISEAVSTQTKFTKLASGQNFTCGITLAGGIKCWGNNEFGQLGNATTTNSSVPVQVQGVTSGATDINAGAMHVCAVIGGAVKCWGSNEDDQISSTLPDYYASVPVAIPNTTGATSLSIGNFHGCAVVGSAVKCWGANFYGQLGNGTTTPAVMTTPVTTGATVVAAGSSHTCAIVSGSIKCWGKNNYGQLGLGNYVDNFSPVTVPSTANTSLITAGDTHTCATIVGIVKCWGQDNFGQLGDGNIVAPSHVSLSPTAITLPGVEFISAGQRNTCAVTTSGTVKCWGYQYSYIPNNTQITAAASFVASGMDHSCAIVDEFAKCWGNNEYGKLGNGSTVNSTAPVDVY